MEKFDPTGTTSKKKVRRYVQAQQDLCWLKWKRILDKQHIESHRQIYTYEFHTCVETNEDGHAPTEEEDFFTSD